MGDEVVQNQTVSETTQAEQSKEEGGFWSGFGSFFKSVGKGFAGVCVETFSYFPCFRQWDAVNKLGDNLLKGGDEGLDKVVGDEGFVRGAVDVVGDTLMAPFNSIRQIGKSVERGVENLQTGDYVAGTLDLTMGVGRAALTSNPVGQLVQASASNLVGKAVDSVVDYSLDEAVGKVSGRTSTGLISKLNSCSENITNEKASGRIVGNFVRRGVGLFR